MKKKPIVIALFIVGLVFICLSIALAFIATANKNIIGGADWPTFIYVFSHENRGIYSTLACCGVIAIVVSVVMGLKKKRP